MALGFLECAGYGAVLYAMDQACKAADIRIMGIDTINSKDGSAFIPLTVQVKFEGSVDDVKIACAAARDAALMLISWDVLQKSLKGLMTGPIHCQLYKSTI